MISIIIPEDQRVLRVSRTSENMKAVEEFYYLQNMYKLIHRYNEGLEYHMLGIIT